jgi:hypothetical protein
MNGTLLELPIQVNETQKGESMFRRGLAQIGYRGVILASVLGLAVTGCSSSSSSSSSPVPASPARAAATVKGTCTTAISNQTVGNVLVPAGQACTLNHVTVKGSITDYGTLQLTTGAAIGGSVLAGFGSNLSESGPATVIVDGNLTLDGPSRFSVTLDYIRGNFTIEETTNSSWTGSHIGGSVFILDNGPGTEFGGNTVAGNISCDGNATAPVNGGTPNKVYGHETGQCAHLH